MLSQSPWRSIEQVLFKDKRKDFSVVLLAVFLSVIFSLGCVLSYQSLYADYRAKKHDEARRLLLSFEASSLRLFDYADSYLRALRAYHYEHGTGTQWREFLQTIKAPHSEQFSGVVTVVDRNGWVVYQSETPDEHLSSYGSMAKLDHFQYFIGHSGDSLFIGATRLGKMTGKYQYRVGRPLLKDGNFDGMVMLTLVPDQLMDPFKAMSLGRHSSVTMMTLEPKLIARLPRPNEDAYDRKMANLKESYGVDLQTDAEGQVFDVGSPFEPNSRRDIFFKRLPDYPIAIVVGVSELDLQDDMANARNSLFILAALFSASALIVAMLMLREKIQNRRLTAALAANREAEEQLRIAAAAFDSQGGTLITDAEGVIIRVNRAFSDSTGYQVEELVGKTPRVLKSEQHNDSFYQNMWEKLKQTGGWQGEIWDRRKNGEVFPKWLTISAVRDAKSVITHYVATHFDISERKKAEERIQELAFYDQLTGLPNRTLLRDRLKQSMIASERSGNYGALLFVDLDNFKTINDTLGHDCGDLLLKEVAKHLSTCIRAGDTAARIGGDEFVIILKDLGTILKDAAAHAEKVGEKILLALGRPYFLNDHDYHCTPSIGVTLFGNKGETLEEMLKQADLAMYQAKAAGRNTLRFFDPEVQTGVATRLVLERDMRKAIQEQQFVLHYQPQIDLRGRCVAAEALLRWLHPERGMVGPDTFIPLSEETGLILPLGQWVLETACRQLVEWEKTLDFAHLSVAVNVSGKQLHQKDFVERVVAILDRTGVDPRRLKLELTESQLLTEVEGTIAKITALKNRGVNFVLDDFGTGYSSLSYLKRLPLEKLKIDRSFVRDVLTDPNDAAITKTVIALAKTLGLGVLAEGVETEEQRQFLESNGCFLYQGYLFGRPLSLADFENFARLHGG